MSLSSCYRAGIIGYFVRAVAEVDIHVRRRQLYACVMASTTIIITGRPVELEVGRPRRS